MSRTQPRLRLYHYWRSSSSWRVRWALQLKGIGCEFAAVNLLSDEAESPAHLARNPLGYVPVLEIIGGGTSPHYLSESMAIIEWAEEVFPTPSLLPGDALMRARIRQLAEMINSGTQPLQNLNVQHYHSPDPAEQKKWNAHWIRAGLNAYEALVGETAGQFSVGDQLTLADLFLIPQCYNASRHEIPLSEFPRIEKIHAAAIVTASCLSSHPDRFTPRS